MNIFEANNTFDFSMLNIGTPYPISKDTYFTKINYQHKSLFIQTPKIKSKQGIIQNKRKSYCDLLFTHNEDEFINWIEKLEITCHQLLLDKSNIWFENKLDKNDIETTFQSPLKIYKSGKYYLLKTNVKNGIKIYDENNQIINTNDITMDTNMITILEVQGIEFTSRNFQIEFEMKQAMIVSPDPFLDNFFIKPQRPVVSSQSTSILSQQEPITASSSSSPPPPSSSSSSSSSSFSLDDLILNYEKNKQTIINNIETLPNKPLIELDKNDEMIEEPEPNDDPIEPNHNNTSTSTLKPDEPPKKIRFTEDTIDNSNKSLNLIQPINNDDNIEITDENYDITSLGIETLEPIILQEEKNIGENRNDDVLIKHRMVYMDMFSNFFKRYNELIKEYMVLEDYKNNYSIKINTTQDNYKDIKDIEDIMRLILEKYN